MVILLLVVALIGGIMIGLPIVFSIGLAGIIGLAALGEPHWVLLSQQFWSGLDSFPLVAVPLFLLMAHLMEHSGVTKAIVDFALSIVGRVRGALALAAVMATTFVSGITGSSAADVTAVGSVMIPAMKREGYGAAFAGAVVGASGMLGPIIPPSILMILFSFGTGESVIRLFLGGIGPGLMTSAAFMVLAYYQCKRRGYGTVVSSSPRDVTKSFVRAIPALVIPFLVVSGVVGGVFTITESAAVAAIYAAILVMFRLVPLGWKGFKTAIELFRRATADTAVVSILLAASGLLAWVVTVSQAPAMIVKAVVGATDSPFLIQAIMNVIMLALGMFIAPAPGLLVATPLLFPLANSIGMDPTHFGVMMVFNLQVGTLYPPVAEAAFIVSRIAGVRYEAQVAELLPWCIIAMIGLIVVTYFPPIVLVIPDLLLGPR